MTRPIGYKHTEVTKQKLRKSNLGKSLSNETIKLLKIIRIGNNYALGNKNMLGKHHTEKTRQLLHLKMVKYVKCNGEFKKHLKKIGFQIGNIPITKNKTYEVFYGKERAVKIKEKLKENMKNNPNAGTKGKYFSFISKEKMKIAQLGNKSVWYGKHHSNETKRKIKENQHDFLGSKNPIWGKHHSEKTRKKIKKSLDILKEKGLYKMPKKDTTIEVKIQKFLEELKIEYFKHKYIKEIKHGYQCDIFIPSLNLVIECDGDYWHSYPTGKEIDHIRTSELIEKGFKVLRLWEFEINKMNIEEFNRRLEI